MPKMSRIELLSQREQPILSIRVRTSIDKLPQLIGENYGKMGAYLNELGELLCNVPFVAYYNHDMQNMDVEMGFPTAKPLPAKGEIQSRILPAGKTICCMYRGPYNGLEPIYNEMAQWITDHGFTPVGCVYKYYYNDLEFPPQDLLTSVMMPLK